MQTSFFVYIRFVPNSSSMVSTKKALKRFYNKNAFPVESLPEKFDISLRANCKYLRTVKTETRLQWLFGIEKHTFCDCVQSYDCTVFRMCNLHTSQPWGNGVHRVTVPQTVHSYEVCMYKDLVPHKDFVIIIHFTVSLSLCYFYFSTFNYPLRCKNNCNDQILLEYIL